MDDSISVCIPLVNGISGICYSWRNLDVKTSSQNQGCCKWLGKRQFVPPKHILKGVNGDVRRGDFLAIMGASGAGKTTLLNVLTCRRLYNLQVRGEVYLNGIPVNPDSLTRVSAYIQQEDNFVGVLTVREHLEFQANLRMDKGTSRERRLIRINEVLKEVLTNPQLFFCDEPTSGLDSYMAQNIVTMLTDMAKRGTTVICTIHQPSSEVFALFDKLLLIAEGRVAYMGPAKDTVNFFQSCGLICPPNYNPADFFVHSLATIPGKEEESHGKITVLCDIFETTISKSLHHYTEDSDLLMPEKKSPYKANWLQQFLAVLWRCSITILRAPQALRVQVMQTIAISCIVTAVFQGQELNEQGIQNINGAIFMFVINQSFSNVFAVVNVFTEEISVFLHEHDNGMYRTDVYFLAKTMSDLPRFIILPVLFLMLPYFTIGLNPSIDRFIIAAGICILVALCATSYGYMVSCASPNLATALAISAPMMVPLMLFGGFFLNNNSVPFYFVWLKYLSWFMYANEVLNINQWTGIQNITCRHHHSISIANATISNCTSDGEDVLERLGFMQENFFWNVCCMIGLIIGFRLVAFLLLLKRSQRK
ncbi:protein white-like isoform X2 [Artemia franciscana]|uniref:protein white-like isoform X2 n=1 Tax=Artemia franciscana TaxID=6661 RepID=UPI0032DAA7AC